MPYLGDNERQRLERVQLPGDYPACVGAVRAYLDKTGLSAAEFAERVGKGRSSVNLFVQGRWENHKPKGWHYLAAHLISYVERHPIAAPVAAQGRLFKTENYRRISSYVSAAVRDGEVCLLYGPPGTQKSFVLEHLVAERNRGGKDDLLYVYSSDEMAPLELLRRIGRAAGVMTGWHYRGHLIDNLIYNFRNRPHAPAVLVDEAQHLRVTALEFLRELHDRSGCGLVLAGSHNLYENFLRGRQHLEQWLSRIDRKEPLPGLLEDEVREIAGHELGNGQPAKFIERQIRQLVEACRVDDVFARGPDGKPAPRKYLSVRRLVKVLAQYKQAKAAA